MESSAGGGVVDRWPTWFSLLFSLPDLPLLPHSPANDVIMAFDSPEAQQLNKDIFETIHYHVLKASSNMAEKEGLYEMYNGSPMSKEIILRNACKYFRFWLFNGILQLNMWGITPSDWCDWNALRGMIAKNGVRNSLSLAPMLTTSTSQILRNNQCFELNTSNIYSPRVLSGEFVVVNKHLLRDSTEMGLWSYVLRTSNT